MTTVAARTTATPNVARVLVVDLATPGVSLGATKTNERKRTTSSYAKLVGSAAAGTPARHSWLIMADDSGVARSA